MQKATLLISFLFFSVLSAYEHDLFQNASPVPNILFMVDTSGSMDYGVYDWKIDYKSWAEAVCTQNNYCLQSDLDYTFGYALDSVNSYQCSGGNWNSWKSKFYNDYHGNISHRNKVYVMFNNNNSVEYDFTNKTANDPGDPHIPWQTDDFYQGFNRDFNKRDYTRGWIINPQWMEDVRQKLKDDPTLVEKIRKNETISSLTPMYKCKTDNTYPCSDPSEHDPISVDSEGHVIFNEFAPGNSNPEVSNNCKGLHLPDGTSCETTSPRALYKCGYDADGDGTVEPGECPRKLTPQQLAMELMEPGYLWTGYLYIDDGSYEPVFLTTGNWINMQPFYNLHLSRNGYYEKYIPAWKACTFSEEYATSSAVFDGYEKGKMLEKKSGRKNPFWWGGDASDGTLIFTVITDPSNETYNGKGITLTKYRYKIVGQEGTPWDTIPSEQYYEFEKPIKTYRHYRNGEYYIPNNYAVDIVIKPRAQNVVAIQAYFKVFDLPDSKRDFVMMRHEDHRRMYRRLDAVELALSEIINEKSYIEEDLPWAVGFYPVSQGSGYSTYVDYGNFRSDIGDNYVDQFNALYSFFAEGGTPTGEALLKSWDYYYRNQDKLWTCRDNRVLIITDGYPSTDDPSGYMSHRKSTSDPKSTWLSPSGPPAYSYYSTNKMELVAEFLYGKNVPSGSTRPKLYHSPHDGDSPNSPHNGVNRAENIIIDAISFGYDVQRLKRVVEVSKNDSIRKGRYYSVSNPDSLKMAVNEIVSGAINDNASVTATPAVNMDGDSFGNDIYMSIFAPHTPGHWWGTINKLCITNQNDNDGCLFLDDGSENDESAVKEKFTDMVHNYSNITDISDGFKTGTNAKLKKDIASNPGSARDVYYFDSASGKFDQWPPAESNEKINNFVQGCLYKEGSCTSGDIRPNPLGDFWHSSPLIVDHDGTEYILVGANDGFLHIFKTENSNGTEPGGEEVKVIAPAKELIARQLKANYVNVSDKTNTYGVDLTPRRLQSDRLDYISIGYRRGGHGYTFIKTDDLMGDGLDGASGVRWKNGFGQSWGNPTVHRTPFSNMIVVPYGYDSFFDADNMSASEFPGVNAHGYFGASTKHYPIPIALKSFKYEGETKTYPVVSDIFPFNYRVSTKYDKAPLETLFDDEGKTIDTNAVYYADIKGSVYMVKSFPPSVKKVFDLTELSSQNPASTKNRDLLKVTGSVAPVLRKKEKPDSNGNDRDVWVFFGTGDITRTAE